MTETIVIDKIVLRELTEHNKVAKRIGFNNNGKIHFLMTLRNVHYVCTWACPTPLERYCHFSITIDTLSTIHDTIIS